MPSIQKRIGQLLHYAPRLFWVDTLLYASIIGLPIVSGMLIRAFFDSLTHGSTPSESPWVWIGLLLTTGLARIVAIFTGRITKTQHRFLISGLVRHNLLLGLLNRPGAGPASVSANGPKTSPGEILSYFRDDAAQIEETVIFVNEISITGLFALVAVFLLFSVNPIMTVLIFLPLCAIAIISRQVEHRLKRYNLASRQATQAVTGLMGEMFTAVQAIKVTGAETEMLNELTRRCDRRRQLVVKDQVFMSLLESGFATIVSLGIGVILIVASQSLGAQGNLTVGDFALFVYYLSFITYFFSFLGGFWATTQQSDVSFQRMAQLVGSSSAITAPHPLYLKPIFGQAPSLQHQVQIPKKVPLQEFRAEGLTYYYPGDARPGNRAQGGIADINLTLPRGSLTVITGSVGSGKTTLLRVLLGLLPLQSGQLLWNDQEIFNPANFLVPPNVAYTPQIPQLFSTSLRENLLLGMADLGDSAEQRLAWALSHVVFEPDLARMPNGLDTLIGTRGFRLSGGQKQRIAAARMLMRQPELIVFDDLSSALDIETEQKLWNRLFAETASQWRPTFLVVSHRRAVMERCDRIILLNQGRVEMAGTFDELPPKYAH